MILLLDIDGSLADISQRYTVAGAEPDRSDKAVYQDWLDRLQSQESLAADKPIKYMQDVIRALEPIADAVVYLTGRSTIYHEVTANWLGKHDFPPGEIFMRETTDYRGAGEYKHEQLAHIIAKYGNEIIVLDDDVSGDTAPVYRKFGALHLKVMECI